MIVPSSCNNQSDVTRFFHALWCEITDVDIFLVFLLFINGFNVVHIQRL